MEEMRQWLCPTVIIRVERNERRPEFGAWVYYDWVYQAARTGKEMWFGNSSAVSWAWSGRGLFQMWQNGVGVGEQMEKELGTRENLIIRCANSLQTYFCNYVMLNRTERMKKNEELRGLDVEKLVILESEQWDVFLDNQIREQKRDLFQAAPKPTIRKYLHWI